MRNYTMLMFANKYEMMLPPTTTKCDATEIIIDQIALIIRDAVYTKLNDINKFMTHKVACKSILFGYFHDIRLWSKSNELFVFIISLI